jgi:hypothetical protein
MSFGEGRGEGQENKLAKCPKQNREGRHSYTGILRLCWHTHFHLLSKDDLSGLSWRENKPAYFICLPFYLYHVPEKISGITQFLQLPYHHHHLPTSELLTVQMFF